MNSLLDFVQFTKASEYLIAVTFFFCFIAFWQVMGRRRRHMGARLALALGLAAVSGGLAFAVILTHEPGPSPDRPVSAPLVSTSVLEEMYGPAAFDHQQHQARVNECTLCHHKSGDSTPPCKTCHDPEYDPNQLQKPNLTHVFHVRCIGCHKENQEGPTDCDGCHTNAEVPALSINHPLTDASDCRGCHGMNIPGMRQLPGDHADATNGVCQLCHRPQVIPTAVARRRIPHSLEGFSNCLLCHGEGIVGAPVVPGDHSGRRNETCLICHRPGETETPVTDGA